LDTELRNARSVAHTLEIRYPESHVSCSDASVTHQGWVVSRREDRSTGEDLKAVVYRPMTARNDSDSASNREASTFATKRGTRVSKANGSGAKL
jgi:Tfp pilus assembly protein FimT